MKMKINIDTRVDIKKQTLSIHNIIKDEYNIYNILPRTVCANRRVNKSLKRVAVFVVDSRFGSCVLCVYFIYIYMYYMYTWTCVKNKYKTEKPSSSHALGFIGFLPCRGGYRSTALVVRDIMTRITQQWSHAAAVHFVLLYDRCTQHAVLWHSSE